MASSPTGTTLHIPDQCSSSRSVYVTPRTSLLSSTNPRYSKGVIKSAQNTNVSNCTTSSLYNQERFLKRKEDKAADIFYTPEIRINHVAVHASRSFRRKKVAAGSRSAFKVRSWSKVGGRPSVATPQQLADATARSGKSGKSGKSGVTCERDDGFARRVPRHDRELATEEKAPTACSRAQELTRPCQLFSDGDNGDRGGEDDDDDDDDDDDGSYSIPRRRLLLWTTMLAVGYGTLGFGASLLAPTLLAVNGPAWRSAVLLATRACGSFVGTAMAANSVARLSTCRELGFSFLTVAASSLGIAFSLNFAVIAILLLIQSIALFFCDSAVNALCRLLWERSSHQSLIKLVHMLYSFGSILAPLSMLPFMFTEASHSPLTGVTWTYVIASFILSISGVLIVFLNVLKCTEFSMRHLLVHRNLARISSHDHQLTSSSQEKNASVIAIVLACIVQFIVVGIEMNYPAFIVLRAVRKFSFSNIAAVSLAALVASAHAFGRLLSSSGLPPVSYGVVLMIDLFIIMASLVCQLLSLSMAPRFLWLTATLIGFALSSAAPASLRWTESHLKHSTQRNVALYTSGFLGSLLLAVVCGCGLDDSYAFEAILLATLLPGVLSHMIACGIADKHDDVAQEMHSSKILMRSNTSVIQDITLKGWKRISMSRVHMTNQDDLRN